jgi:hypothetical protein
MNFHKYCHPGPCMGGFHSNVRRCASVSTQERGLEISMLHINMRLLSRQPRIALQRSEPKQGPIHSETKEDRQTPCFQQISPWKQPNPVTFRYASSRKRQLTPSYDAKGQPTVAAAFQPKSHITTYHRRRHRPLGYDGWNSNFHTDSTLSLVGFVETGCYIHSRD